eukprot:gene10009-10163_t
MVSLAHFTSVPSDLAPAAASDLAEKDFMHHILKSCVVVFLTARDEASCFTIFSTLNGRGVDLAVVDKLKPELLQALLPKQRQSYGERWAALEHPDVTGMLEQVLEYGQRLLQIRANDWSLLAAEGGSAPSIAAELEEACFFVNLLVDTTWQPWALEFFYQSADDAKRAAFLKGAELLQLYCELKQDMAVKQQRWLKVGEQLLQRPFYSDQVTTAAGRLLARLAAGLAGWDAADSFTQLSNSLLRFSRGCGHMLPKQSAGVLAAQAEL